MANSQMEDEDKMGSDQEVIESEHELIHNKEATEKELVKAYVKDKEDKDEEAKQKIKDAQDKAIVENDKFMKKTN